MSLIYNKDTAVERDIKTQNSSEYNYYSNNNLEQQSQNEKFVYSVDLAEQETQNYTLLYDVVLTCLQLTVIHGVGGGYETIHAKINNETIAHLHVESSASNSAQDSIIINLPNWILREGDILEFETTEGGAGSGSGSGSFIGYKV